MRTNTALSQEPEQPEYDMDGLGAWRWIEAESKEIQRREPGKPKPLFPRGIRGVYDISLLGVPELNNFKRLYESAGNKQRN